MRPGFLNPPSPPVPCRYPELVDDAERALVLVRHQGDPSCDAARCELALEGALRFLRANQSTAAAEALRRFGLHNCLERVMRNAHWDDWHEARQLVGRLLEELCRGEDDTESRSPKKK